MHYAAAMGMHISYETSLRAWLDLPGAPTITSFAKRIGVTRVYLSQIKAGQNGRQPSPALCVAIERESGGAVTRADLRPTDYWLIWPDLPAPGAAKGAPPIPNAEQGV
jgi:DNA-binding transcriptional regulator YdaS (Cro superfamily)